MAGLGNGGGPVTVTSALCAVDCPAQSAQTKASGLSTYDACNDATAGSTRICPTPSISGFVSLGTSICATPSGTVGGIGACAIVRDAICTSNVDGNTQTFVCTAGPTSNSAVTTSSATSSNSVPASTTASAGISTPASTGTSPTGVAKASSTSKPASNGNQKSTGITGGAAAGIAIGCLVAGIAIAALIFFFLFRRYKRRQEQRQASSGYMHHLGSINGGVGSTAGEKSIAPSAVKPGIVVSAIEKYLPQPAEDDAISGGLSRLRDKIKNHAQNFYHNAAVDPVMVDESELQDVARATGIRSLTLCDMLLNPQTRTATIRLILGYFILSRCGAQDGARALLLPPEVGLFVDALAETEIAHTGQAALKSKWHSISATLLAPRYSGSTFSDSDARSHSIAATITSIDSVLRPFVSSHQNDADRLRNLQAVVQRAAAFAFLLFAQPSTFKLQWASHGKLAVFPALLQTSDENAQVLNPPRVFVELEVV